MTDRTGLVAKTRRSAIIASFLLFIVADGFSQKLPIVAAYSLVSNDVGDHIAKTVDDLVFSFVKELRSYTIVDMRRDQRPRDLRVPDGTDYIFYGTMTSERDGIKLELVLKGGPFGVTRLLSRVYENSNLILLESRLLVRDIFDQSIELPDPFPTASLNGNLASSASPAASGSPQDLRSVSNIDSLAGAWQGEDGIEKIMLLRGGRGVAVLSSGVSISLEIIMSGDDLVIRQKGASNPRQFSDLPDPVARQAATIAPPLEWRFLITPDQKILSGTKKHVKIKNDGKNIITMENEVTLVSWTRD